MGKERRQDFRLPLFPPVEGTAQIKSIDDQPTPVDKDFPLTILDVSAGGLKVKTPLDLEASKHTIMLQVDFGLEEFNFNIRGQIIRREDKDVYGIKFTDLSPKDEKSLVRCLYKVERKKKRLYKMQRLEKEDVKNPIVKIIEAIPYACFLLNSERKIIAVNQFAERLGYLTGDICHKAIFDRDTPCLFCKLHASREIDRIVKLEIRPQKTNRQVAHWLYLNNGIYLHYFRKGGYSYDPESQLSHVHSPPVHKDQP